MEGGGQVKFLASGRGGEFLLPPAGGAGFIFDAEKYKPPAPKAVNSEPSLIPANVTTEVVLHL